MDRDDALIEEARRALGLAPSDVMGAAVREGEVTIVTVGGHKARWRPGAPGAPLGDFAAGRPAATPQLDYRRFAALPAEGQERRLRAGAWPPRMGRGGANG